MSDDSMDILEQYRSQPFVADQSTTLTDPNKICLETTMRLLDLLSIHQVGCQAALKHSTDFFESAKSLASTIALNLGTSDQETLSLHWGRFAQACQRVTSTTVFADIYVDLAIAKADLEDILRGFRTMFAMQYIDSSVFAASQQISEVPVPEPDACRLLSIDADTWRQWQTYKTGTVVPYRLAAIAKSVYFIQSSLTAPGVAAWFDRPRYQLQNQTPLRCIEAGQGDVVIRLASEGRFQTAS